MKHFNLDTFLEKSKKIHKDKYDYTHTKYNGYRKLIEIVCPKHGSFFQRVDTHLKGCGCRGCFSDGRKLLIEDFVKKARILHGDKYDYTLVEYVDNRTKVKIKCNICGYDFYQVPARHLRGQGCSFCTNHIRHTLSSFIKKSKSMFGPFRFDYSKVNFKNNKSSIILICNNCGSEVKTTIDNHFHSKIGCSQCSRNELKRKFIKSHEDFVKDVKSISPNIEILSEYKGDSGIVQFRCRECGNLGKKVAGSFLYKSIGSKNCSICYRKKVTKTHETFVEELKKINPNFVVLEKYIKNDTPINIKCSVCNYRWKADPRSILNHKSGCPSCSGSFGEQKIREYLTNRNIYFKFQKKFKGFKEVRRYSFDFYVPEVNSIIEFDGEQHFKNIEFFHSEKEFKNYVKRDFIKNEFCINKGMHIIRINYKYFYNIEYILDEEINNILLHRTTRLGGRHESFRYG